MTESTGFEPEQYAPLTPRAALQLAAPPTWIASVGPVCVGGLAASFATGPVPWRDVLLWLLMLLCAVAAQSAANTLNDYKDFVSGLDTEENCVDTTDASIIYNHLAPHSARNFGLFCLGVALVAGVAVALLSTLWLLALGGVGIILLLSYSYGPVKMSYLPMGEIVSGLAFGLIITTATFVAMTGSWHWILIPVCLQQVINVGLIMMTNNTCDIERDQDAGRRTLPVLLGRKRSLVVMAAGHVLALGALGVLALLLDWVAVFPVLVASVFVVRLLLRFVDLRFDALDRPRAMRTSIRLAHVLTITSCSVLFIATVVLKIV
jgi:1,4-dihydroxy-2-naphthoate octaprenyltransferase